jgi:hypothetical protein
VPKSVLLEFQPSALRVKPRLIGGYSHSGVYGVWPGGREIHSMDRDSVCALQLFISGP